jgi:MFS transporter, DHA1 family, tetracycline resistance protein
MRFPSLLFTVFLDSLGFGLVIPLLSSLIMNEQTFFLREGTSLEIRGFVFGALIAFYCLGQFFGSPILGALSDRKGRKKILLSTLWMAFLGYLIGGLSVVTHSLAGLFLSRILAGIAAGNYTIAQSMIVDFSEENEKTKNFALLGMAWGLGFILGPYLGGEFSDASWCSLFCWETPFWVAAIFCFLNILLVRFFLKETLRFRPEVKIQWLAGLFHLKKAFSLAKLRTLFFVMFVFCLGWGFFTEFSPIFLIRHLGAEIKDVSLFFACVGLWLALCQGVLIRPFLKWFSPQRLLAASLFLMGALLLVLLVVKTLGQLHVIIPFLAFCEAFIFPSAATLVSDLSDKEMQGEVFGIYNSIQWAAIGFSPLFSGALVARYPHLPVSIASVCMFGGFVFFLWSQKRMEKNHTAQNIYK